MSKAQFLSENQRPGEIYAGLILGKNGGPDYYLFLLEEKPEALLNWDDAKKWAISVGGELPNLCEQSLLLANAKEHFDKDWHWSSEPNAHDDSYAWMQGFDYGYQGGSLKSYEFRARAVRRVLIIQQFNHSINYGRQPVRDFFNFYLPEQTMNITIEAIKEQHNKVAQMITAFEANAKLSAAFPITVNFPELNTGEQYVTSIISADGKKREHIILLPGELTDSNWDESMTWAKSIGGELPDRVESALLFATLKDEFQSEYYWTREQNARNDSYAWMQDFGSGGQGGNRKSIEYRARAVRRVLIIQ